MKDLSYLLGGLYSNREIEIAIYEACMDDFTRREVNDIMIKFRDKIKLGKSFKMPLLIDNIKYELEYRYNNLCIIWSRSCNEVCTSEEFLKNIKNNKLTEALAVHVRFNR